MRVYNRFSLFNYVTFNMAQVLQLVSPHTHSCPLFCLPQSSTTQDMIKTLIREKCRTILSLIIAENNAHCHRLFSYFSIYVALYYSFPSSISSMFYILHRHLILRLILSLSTLISSFFLTVLFYFALCDAMLSYHPSLLYSPFPQHHPSLYQTVSGFSNHTLLCDRYSHPRCTYVYYFIFTSLILNPKLVKFTNFW